ncbi:hypothetical protein [Methylovulum miyakonense]|uniref:hypothetical protein n=1 Tax=Methylovulum miyakonense TaxID=645578 RepID=UPI000368BD71|nr:hypothetical protein [Methylovulum miyakonense]
MNESTKFLITNLANRYRECVRSIWNIYFMDQYQATQNWDLLDSFKRIEQELFDSIVLVPALPDDEEEFNYRLGSPCPKIKIIPSQIPDPGDKWDIPVEINRTKGETSGYWDHPITRINSKAELAFVDFFDWDSYGFIDMSKIVAEIKDYPENPNLIGHRLIVELVYVDIVFIT